MNSQFELLNAKLEGSNLVEASAGTGKTYAITILFLRLIVEKSLDVNQILVVTFTEAATEELKLKIRERLSEALGAFSGDEPKSLLLKELVESHHDRKRAAERIRAAISNFDEAAIFTIHGFCNRTLRENAFESGELFDTELAADNEKLKLEIVEDFWRRNLYGESQLFANFVISRTSPQDLLKMAGRYLFRPNLTIVPKIEAPDSGKPEKKFGSRFGMVAEKWPSARADVEKILLTHNSLKRNYYPKGSIPVWIREMDDYVAAGGDNPTTFKRFAKFTTGVVENSLKKNTEPPSHPFFDLCQELADSIAELEQVCERRLISLQIELFDYLGEELKTRMKSLNIQSFDDMLTDLLRALEGGSGEALAENIRSKYKAALIDEFQDTDPVQYDIFRRVFDGGKAALFLIGDPKQAIYAFRGADIFTYMEAKRRVEREFTLDRNWRSEPGLVAAVNAVFGSLGNPFAYEEIEFSPVRPAEEKKPEILDVGGVSGSEQMKLWFLNAETVEKNGKPARKARAKKAILKAVSSEISRLVRLGREEKALLDGKPLREEDIAVLVLQNRDAKLMRESLAELKIPSVLYSAGNVFDSHEALELTRLLAGIVEPNNEKLLRAALSTDIMGIGGEKLERLVANESEWERKLVVFREYRELWSVYGFIRMFRSLLSDEDVSVRLMSLTDGERRNTNLLHLSEILHRVSVEKKPSMAGLVKWLAEQRDPGVERSDEDMLRLESDENAVKIVTVHKSKGLEYPIVFCPFMWDDFKLNPKAPVLFHDPSDRRKLVLDLGSPQFEKNLLTAEKERLAENLRLFYVALTRARNRCYFVWGRFHGSESSGPGYLFHGPSARFESETDGGMFSVLRKFGEKTDGAVEIREMPTDDGEMCAPVAGGYEKLRLPSLTRKVENLHRISSFSSLVSGGPHSEEMPDHDPGREPDAKPEQPDEDSKTIFDFPRGAIPGTFMHELFEDLDFTGNEGLQMEELAEKKLDEYGFDPEWREPICGMIENVLSAPLDPDRPDFTLSRIQKKDRMDEMEFYFPLKKTEPLNLKHLLEKHAGHGVAGDFPDRLGRLSFSPAKGFMKGFTDIVFQFDGKFYLADWKSNHLGYRPESYDREAMEQAMKEHYYILQYLIYVTALDRYLELRMPGYGYETHFGGVYYVFLRGVDSSAGDFGIFRDRPPADLIAKLRDGLMDV